LKAIDLAHFFFNFSQVIQKIAVESERVYSAKLPAMLILNRTRVSAQCAQIDK
jgi:hypothetical protein